MVRKPLQAARQNNTTTRRAIPSAMIAITPSPSSRTRANEVSDGGTEKRASDYVCRIVLLEDKAGRRDNRCPSEERGPKSWRSTAERRGKRECAGRVCGGKRRAVVLLG